MHRVELKEEKERLSGMFRSTFVPNAPCGVERRFDANHTAKDPKEFLMHRVELKVPPVKKITRNLKGS